LNTAEANHQDEQKGRPVQSDRFRPFLPAEEEIVSRLLSGDLDRLGDGSRPEADDPSRAVRAAFLRFLLLGGEEGYRPHEKGVRLSGAYIRGVLDLEACRVFRDIGLKDCRFDAAPVLRSAVIDRLFLDGSFLPGIDAERLEARGGLYLRGAHVSGEIRLADARLGGNLACDGATIHAIGGIALNARSLEVRNIYLRGADIRGGINVSGAQLAADFDCAGLVVYRPDKVAIGADAIKAGGSVILRAAAVEGEVRLLGSHIGGDLDCTGAAFVNPGHNALQLSRTLIEGAFFLRNGAEVKGLLDMQGASIDTVHDEFACWPGKGDVRLNRCR
jgi:hypothetical protein